MFNLGAAYYNGDGVGIDDARAYAWFLLAQDAGSQTATDAVQRSERELGPTILSLGMNYVVEMYFKGVELNRDYKEGIRWLRKSAAGGRARRVGRAGVLTPHRFTSDYEEGRHWLRLHCSRKANGILLELYTAKAWRTQGHKRREPASQAAVQNCTMERRERCASEGEEMG